MIKLREICSKCGEYNSHIKCGGCGELVCRLYARINEMINICDDCYAKTHKCLKCGKEIIMNKYSICKHNDKHIHYLCNNCNVICSICDGQYCPVSGKLLRCGCYICDLCTRPPIFKICKNYHHFMCPICDGDMQYCKSCIIAIRKSGNFCICIEDNDLAKYTSFHSLRKCDYCQYNHTKDFAECRTCMLTCIECGSEQYYDKMYSCQECWSSICYKCDKHNCVPPSSKDILLISLIKPFTQDNSIIMLSHQLRLYFIAMCKETIMMYKKYKMVVRLVRVPSMIIS